MALTLNAIISDIQVQTVGSNTIYMVTYQVQANVGNSCPSGQESRCIIRVAVPQATAAGLVVGTATVISTT